MNKQVKCLKCKKIVEAGYKQMKECGCDNETFIDGGDEHYMRCGGKDMSKVAVKHESKWKKLRTAKPKQKPKSKPKKIVCFICGEEPYRNFNGKEVCLSCIMNAQSYFFDEYKKFYNKTK
jgi:hypothetical protein